MRTTIRSEEVYISKEVWLACWHLARAGSRTEESESRLMTADEMCDRLLREVITTKYPQLFELQEQIRSLEKEAIKALQLPADGSLEPGINTPEDVR